VPFPVITGLLLCLFYYYFILYFYELSLATFLYEGRKSKRNNKRKKKIKANGQHSFRGAYDAISGNSSSKMRL